MKEYCVVSKREGMHVKRARFVQLKYAEKRLRAIRSLGVGGEGAWGDDGDQRGGIPKLLYSRIEEREVGPWVALPEPATEAA